MAKASTTCTYDYIELKIFDVHGYPRGRIISESQFPGVIKDGMGMRHGMCYEGLRGRSNRHAAFTTDVGYANARITPVLSTLKPCQKSVRENRRIGSVLCELRYAEDFSLNTSSPRDATQMILQRLQSEFGLHLKSSFEMEFGIKDSRSQTYLGDGSQWGSLTTLRKHQGLFIGLLDDMQELGIKVDTLLSERGVGQFEVTLEPTEGIEAVDMVAEFRSAAYLYLKSKGCDAEFMACTDRTVDDFNGYHFNFSVWNSDGDNVFVDPENPNELSQLGKHWLAGLVEHTPAMLAMCSPTTNCYRRAHTKFGPTFANWALEDRCTSFRLKIEPRKNVYIENRIPSSACNPYLVLACTVAAGMDGVRRKLELPEPSEKTKKLPASLKEALEALEADTLLKEAIGPKMVDLFIDTKRKYDLEHFAAFGDLCDEELFLKEKEYYYDPL